MRTEKSFRKGENSFRVSLNDCEKRPRKPLPERACQDHVKLNAIPTKTQQRSQAAPEDRNEFLLGGLRDRACDRGCIDDLGASLGRAASLRSPPAHSNLANYLCASP
jgi:hypothetical protein